jgi:serine/threonine protein kinase
MTEAGTYTHEQIRGNKVTPKEVFYKPGAPAGETAAVLPSPLTYFTDEERAQQPEGAFVAEASQRFQINRRDLLQQQLNGLDYSEQPNGVIVFAKDIQRKLDVAIKFLNPWKLRYKSGNPREKKDIQERIAEFYHEAKVLQKLSHPHIIKAHGVVLEQVNGMEVPGIVLDKLQQINYRNMQAGNVLEMVEQIGAALDYAESQGIIHQDVNPHNLLLNNEGKFILTDFGIADDASEPILKGGGAPPFADPWQQNVKSTESQQLKGRTNQYGLAMTALYALKRLPEGAQLTVGAGSQMRLTTAGRPLPPEVMRVLNKATAYRREDRYTSCTEFVNELQIALGPDAKRQISPRVGKHTGLSILRLMGLRR